METLAEIKINPAEHAVALTTTLNRLKKAGACASGYAASAAASDAAMEFQAAIIRKYLAADNA